MVSHERSGTHFLMNGLRRAYGYSAPHLAFDWHALPIDYRNPTVVANVLGKIGNSPGEAIVKSHHALGFFDGVLDRVLRNTPILYIHRDPVDVMVSFWRYARQWLGGEMAHAATAFEFAASPPSMSMTRYQATFCRTILERWGQHVDNWTSAASTRRRLVVVRYDQLRDRYADTMTGLEKLLGPVSGTLDAPDRETDVIAGMPADRLPAPDRIALQALALRQVGETMRRHAYA